MSNYTKPTIGIVVPCFNEQEILPHTTEELFSVVQGLIQGGEISSQSFIGFVDDGSKDNTWETIVEQKHKYPHIKALKLAGNYGHQNALLAGLFHFNTHADALVSMDADLQDDVRVIADMVSKYKAGCDIVYGVRKKRDHDSWFKKYSALLFYKSMKCMGVRLVYNHADYRLTSKSVICALEQYEETNLFLRGIFPSMGFVSDSVYYDRTLRTAGSSKYPFLKMLGFAWQGVTSFSITPLRLVTVMGFLVFGVSFFVGAYVIFARYYLQVVHGWASTVLPIYFLGGIQLLAIGIIGEYLGKIYQEVKRRPRYVVSKEI